MLFIPTGSQATGYKTPSKAEGEAAEAARRAREQQAAYEAKLAEIQRRMREAEQSAARTQLMRGPNPQQIGPTATATQDQRKRKMGSSRGSLLAGNTGGYNPATGGGRLGGMRSLLG